MTEAPKFDASGIPVEPNPDGEDDALGEAAEHLLMQLDASLIPDNPEATPGGK